MGASRHRASAAPSASAGAPDSPSSTTATSAAGGAAAPSSTSATTMAARPPTSTTRALAALLLVLVAWRVASLALLPAADDGDDDAEGAPAVARSRANSNTKPPKSRQLLGDAEVIQVSSRTGWTPHMGSLVEKREPRPCTKTRITPQVFDPIVYVSAAQAGEGAAPRKPWKRRAYHCVSNHAPCRAVLMEDAEDRRWKRTKNADATFVFTSAAALRASPDFDLIYREREGSTYVDVILSGSGSGSTSSVLDSDSVTAQLDGLQRYARSFGCSFNDLSVQTPRFRANEPAECAEMRAAAQASSRLAWTVFDAAGKAAALSSGELLSRFPDCASAAASAPAVAAQALHKPLLVDKAPFDVRSFLLVGSTMPFMVFFHRGYVRTATHGVGGPSSRVWHGAFDSSEAKSVSLESFQRSLANGHVTGTHYVDTFLKSSMKRVALLVFQAARPKMRRRRGSYQLFALDFLIDDQLRVWFDKVDTHPDPAAPESVFDGLSMVTDMHDLVMELAEEPAAFEQMITGDKYGLWELIMSEVRESCEGTLYNPCHLFHDYNAVPLAKANKKVSGVHNAANREHHEETRIVKKTEEDKKKKCKGESLAHESKACDKLYARLLEADFEKLFAEHERSWNPNGFRLPRPGEILPYERV